MGKRTTYVLTLLQKPESDWIPYLLAESGLPGPRGNLELAQAAADAGRLEQFNAWLEWMPDRAPVNTPEEFLSFCGTVGLGRLLAENPLEHPELLERLRLLAADPRWRMREAVAMALQRLGAQDMDALLDAVAPWAEGRPYEMRAAAAGICEPALLGEEPRVFRVLDMLERITARLEAWPAPRDAEVMVLRQALGYCWSVAAAACPAEGKRRIERWASSPDKDVRWVVRENLSKNRLVRLDPTWVDAMRRKKDN
jgi:hypothetical protein